MKRTLAHWLPLAAFVLATIAALPLLLSPASPRFALDPPAIAVPPTPTFSTRLIANPQPSAHAATLTELPGLPRGRIAAAWFAGSAEGARDAAIYLATFDGHDWSEPRAIVTREQVQHDTGRLVRKLGNPVLATDEQRRLLLWFVSVGYGGWAGSAINHTISTDGGQSWRRSERLVTSPFWNLSTLVRTPPLPLADKGWGLPAYHEFATKRGEWLRLDDAGRVRDKVRIPGSQRALQPAVAALDTEHAIAMLRDASADNHIRMTSTIDAGTTWQAARPTPLPNPNASVALLRLGDGALLLAYNPLAANRDQLALAVSRDGGANWSAPKLIENTPGGEFSYPALLQGRDGIVHLAYTWQRRNIKHIVFTPAWLAQPQ